jgi:hypothetical protein
LAVIDNVEWCLSINNSFKAYLENIDQTWGCNRHIKVFTHYVFTTNNKVLVDDSSMRHFCFVCPTDGKKDDTDFFALLVGDRNEKENLKRVAPSLARWFIDEFYDPDYQEFPHAFDDSGKKVIMPRTKYNGELDTFLVDALRGKIETCYFWDCNYKIFNSNLDTSAYKGHMYVPMFHKEISKVYKQVPDNKGLLFIRLNDISYSYDFEGPKQGRNVKERRVERVEGVLRNLFGEDVQRHIVKRTAFLEGTHYDYWFTVPRNCETNNICIKRVYLHWHKSVPPPSLCKDLQSYRAAARFRLECALQQKSACSKQDFPLSPPA